MTHKIIPTIFALSKQQFLLRFMRLKALSKELQIDFMDGRFVPWTSVQLKDIPNLKRFKKKFEAHLMVRNPKKWIKPLAEKGFDKVIFHYEAVKSKKEALELRDLILSYAMIPALAINPGTSFEETLPLAHEFPIVQLMGVHPGKEGQKFEPVTLQKARRMKEYCKNTIVQVDGGMNPESVRRLTHAGVKIFNTGSYISKNAKPKQALKELQNAIKKGIREEKKVIDISMPYSRITPHIFIGPNKCCQGYEFDRKLLRLGIKADISLEEFRLDKPRGVDHYLWIPTPDHLPPSFEQLHSTVFFMHSLVQQKIKMYVHCELGHTRAPTLVVAYFISIGMSIDDAITRVKSKRPGIGISKLQMKGLQEFERYWKKNA